MNPKNLSEEFILKTLRILFTLIAAVFVALVIPLGALVSWGMAGICVLGAFLFFGLMLLCKQKQEEEEKRARHDDLSGIDFGNNGKEDEKKDK